jgi:hypothetical protein
MRGYRLSGLVIAFHDGLQNLLFAMGHELSLANAAGVTTNFLIIDYKGLRYSRSTVLSDVATKAGLEW